MAAAQRAEEEARLKQKEEARLKQKEAVKMQGEVEEAYEMLGSLDNALKAFTGRFGLEEVHMFGCQLPSVCKFMFCTQFA